MPPRPSSTGAGPSQRTSPQSSASDAPPATNARSDSTSPSNPSPSHPTTPAPASSAPASSSFSALSPAAVDGFQRFVSARSALLRAAREFEDASRAIGVVPDITRTLQDPQVSPTLPHQALSSAPPPNPTRARLPSTASARASAPTPTVSPTMPSLLSAPSRPVTQSPMPPPPMPPPATTASSSASRKGKAKAATQIVFAYPPCDASGADTCQRCGTRHKGGEPSASNRSRYANVKNWRYTQGKGSTRMCHACAYVYFRQLKATANTSSDSAPPPSGTPQTQLGLDLTGTGQATSSTQAAASRAEDEGPGVGAGDDAHGGGTPELEDEYHPDGPKDDETDPVAEWRASPARERRRHEEARAETETETALANTRKRKRMQLVVESSDTDDMDQVKETAEVSSDEEEEEEGEGGHSNSAYEEEEEKATGEEDTDVPLKEKDEDAEEPVDEEDGEGGPYVEDEEARQVTEIDEEDEEEEDEEEVGFLVGTQARATSTETATSESVLGDASPARPRTRSGLRLNPTRSKKATQ
ncbi:hypothetical protein OC834_006316 [Tilletia horrida]|nr:hypothetical protein OC834_006316 [Tilletia horrida]